MRKYSTANIVNSGTLDDFRHKIILIRFSLGLEYKYYIAYSSPVFNSKNGALSPNFYGQH